MSTIDPISKCVAVILTLAIPTASIGQVGHIASNPDSASAILRATGGDSCLTSRFRGQTDAGSHHSTGGWLAGGIAAGTLGGLIGTAVVTGIAAASDPQPALADGAQTSIDACYLNGYTSKAKSKNTWTAFGGGIVGTMIGSFVYFVIVDQN